eukprot:1238133-Alexandrium_andersonii.AAC.1
MIICHNHAQRARACARTCRTPFAGFTGARFGPERRPKLRPEEPRDRARIGPEGFQDRARFRARIGPEGPSEGLQDRARDRARRAPR